MSDWNDKIIAEFRANEGRVGGNFEGAPLLLLHSTGAKSGQERVSPMMYQAVGDGFAVFASKAGADTNPDWFHNLRAHPEARIEVGHRDARRDGAGPRRRRARADLGHPEDRYPGSPTTRPRPTASSPWCCSRSAEPLGD